MRILRHAKRNLQSKTSIECTFAEHGFLTVAGQLHGKHIIVALGSAGLVC